MAVEVVPAGEHQLLVPALQELAVAVDAQLVGGQLGVRVQRPAANEG